jgi:hypothetical protein
MVGALSAYNQITFISSTTEAETKQWLDVNRIVDYDNVIANEVHLEGEDLKQRQITFARAKAGVGLVITGDPHVWAFAFEQGIPSVMFGVPSYVRPEFRPDAPKKVRAWAEIETAIERQNALRTQDARLTRTETLNFE